MLEATERYVEMTLDATRPRTSIGLIGEVDVTRAVVGAVIVSAAVAFAIKGARRLQAGTQAALVLAVASLLLVLHIVPLTLAGSVTADRLLYVPLAAIAAAAAIEARRLRPPRAKVAGAASVVVAGLFAIATNARAQDYTDETRFWVTAAEHAHPDNTMPRRALAAIVREDEDVDLSCRLYERCEAIQAHSPEAGRPAHRRTRENLAACLSATGKYDEALRRAEALTRDYPDVGRVQLSLGYSRMAAQDLDGAREAFTRAAALDAGLAATVHLLMLDLELAKSEWARLEDAQARAADPVGWANHLARIGRRLDADSAFLAIAEAHDESPQVRSAAVEYLARDGTLESAERAMAIHDAPFDREWLGPMVAARRARFARLTPLMPRIVVLAR
jgi:tetratricopeptide (TPR) repeat protein